MSQPEEPTGPVNNAAGADRTVGDEFFVGYLPTPAGHRRAAVIAVVIIGVLLAGVAGVVAWAQRDPGTGTWQSDRTSSLEGVVVIAPYALLRTADESGVVVTVILVSEGKFGATDRLRDHDGKTVRIRGTMLERDGRRMLEVSSNADAVTPLDWPVARRAGLLPESPRPLGRATLRGEFIDPKCYIGAMKPGGGKTHKACAQLCVGGGIPPMFVTRSQDGSEDYFLVIEEGDRSAAVTVIPYLGDPVEVGGEVEMRGDLRVLRIDTTTILRI